MIAGENHRDDLKPKGLRVLKSWQYQKAKEGEKGAVPAISIDGKGTKVAWVKSGAYQTGGRRATTAPKPESPATRLKNLEQQHAAAVENAVVDVFLEQAEKGPPSDARRVLALVAIVGAVGAGYDPKREKAIEGCAKLARALVAKKVDLGEWAALIWPRVVEAMREEVGPWDQAGTGALVMEVCGADLAEIRKLAAERAQQ